MQEIPLTPEADRLLSTIMARGYKNASQVVELALKRMEQETNDEDIYASPPYIAWIQSECRDALAEIDQGGGVDYDMDDILNEANVEFEEGQRELNPSVIP